MTSHRFKQVVFCAILSAVLTLAAAPFLVIYLTTWTEGGLRRSLAAELPPGSSRAQVVAWLDSHQIYHSPLYDQQGNSYSPLTAAIYDANVAWLENGDLNISFYFDDTERLDHCSVEVELISL